VRFEGYFLLIRGCSLEYFSDNFFLLIYFKKMADSFRQWVLQHKTIDTIIIGFFLAEAISRFYANSFETLLNPVISKVLPGDEKSEINVFGAKIKFHKLFVGVIQLLLSFYLAYLLRNFLYKNS
jgi:hypothetical protein